jgi:hypothetical protein
MLHSLTVELHLNTLPRSILILHKKVEDPRQSFVFERQEYMVYQVPNVDMKLLYWKKIILNKKCLRKLIPTASGRCRIETEMAANTTPRSGFTMY